MGYSWSGMGRADWLVSHPRSACNQMSPAVTVTIYITEVLSPPLKRVEGLFFSFLSLPFLVELGAEQRPSCMLCRAHALPLGCTPDPELVETFQARGIQQVLSGVTLSPQGTVEGPMRAKPGTFRVASSPRVGLKWPVGKSHQAGPSATCPG